MILDTYERGTTTAVKPLRREQLLIHGARRPAQSGRYFETVDPASEKVIAEVAEGDAADIDAAVASARQAFEGEWGHMKASERGRLAAEMGGARFASTRKSSSSSRVSTRASRSPRSAARTCRPCSTP